MYNYKAKVVRVVDGDTVDLKVDLGFHISANERFRIKDIDTPEIWRPSCESELEHGRNAKEFAQKLLPVGSTVIVASSKLGIYGRWIGEITLLDSKNYAEVMIENGFEKLETYYDDIL